MTVDKDREPGSEDALRGESHRTPGRPVIVSATITGSRQDEIGDAIRSVVEQVDKVLLVDTGIADATIDRAREVAGDKLAVARHPWKDFSQARNAAIEEAKKLGADWVLIVDSDERMNWGGMSLRDFLVFAEAGGVDVVLMRSEDGHYVKERLVRASASAKYVGPTHETIVGGRQITMPQATFSELPKTAEQLQRKFSRDAELLYDHTTENPTDPRWWYYLGQSLEGLGKHARAAEAFGRCAELRKFGDEAAWASFKQCEQLFILNRHEEAILAAGKGLGAGVMFAECAWMAAVSASRLGRIDDAIAWARIAALLGRYKGIGKERTWFTKLEALYELPFDVLRFVLPTEEGRAEADAQFHEAKRLRLGVHSHEELDRLTVTRGAPPHRLHEARRMLDPKPIESMCPSARATRVAFDPPNGWHPANPSIAVMDGELRCVVRTVNYVIEGKRYIIDDPGGVVRTENYLGVLDLEGNFSEARLIHDLDPGNRQPSLIVGYEDIRLAVIKDREKKDESRRLAMSATVCDRDPARRQVARLKLTPDGDVGRAQVQPSRQWHEKNWMPIVVGDEKLAWIYSLDPTVVIGAKEVSQPCPFDLGHLRGGAAIPFKDGWLVVAHEVIETDERRIYLHRFVSLDEEFRVLRVSSAWVFRGRGIEFCAGMAQVGDEVVMTYGVQDNEAWMTRVPVKEVVEMGWWTP